MEIPTDDNDSVAQAVSWNQPAQKKTRVSRPTWRVDLSLRAMERVESSNSTRIGWISALFELQGWMDGWLW